MMQARIRKLTGTVVLLVLLMVYAGAVAAVAAGRITIAAPWAQLTFFVLAGLL
jgi:uncharacterized protein DUF2842